MERARDLGGADHGPRRERRRRRPARQARARARATRRRSTTRSRGRSSSRPRRPAAPRALAEYTGASLFVVHVTCAAAAAEIEAAQQRGAHVSAETCTQYLVNTIDDLRRPGVEGCRYICSPPLRDASNHEPLWDYVRRGVLESVSTDHCPFNYEQKSRGAGQLQPRAQRPAGHPAPAREALGRGRRRRPDHAEPARGPHEHDDRAPLRPRTTRARSRPARTPTSCVFDPPRPARLRRRRTRS